MSVMEALPPTPRVVRIEITARSIAMILAAAALVWLVYRLWVVAFVIVVALIIAGTLNPLAEWLERKSLSRFHALVVLFTALVVVTAALIFLAVPPLIDQFAAMIEAAPATRLRLIAVLGKYSITTPLAHVVEGAGVAKSLASAEAYLFSYSSQALRVLGYGATTLVLAFYLLADGKRAQGVVYALVPRDYHMRLARIIQNMETIVGGFMRGQLITSAAFGLFTLVLLLVCRVPNALSLAIFAALVDVIPFVGGMIVIIPAVLSALPQGIAVAGVVLLALSVYIEFESRILVPRVYGQYLRLSSTAVVLALLAGGLLMGVLGALLALPIAAGILMMLEELRVDMPGDDRVDRLQNARHARTEAKYEQMSAGATAPDSGEIARALAADTRDADLAEAARPAPGAGA